ncbi:MAG: DJ-1/PfpI family protein [Anaerocolumna sp.]
MGKILCYIYNEMADFEISLLLHRLNKAGEKEIISISEDLEPKLAQSGLTYIPDKEISSITNFEDIEGLIIPGGPINNKQNDICPLITKIVTEEKLVAAICFAPQFLGRAGILNSYKYTTSCSSEKILDLKCDDPFNWNNYVDCRSVVDRNVVTAKGYAFVDFAIEVCEYFNIYENEKQKFEQLYIIKEK